MIALLADVHVANHKRHPGPIKAGINRRCQYTLDTLEAAVKRAKEKDAKVFVILGDLFDTTKPEPQVIRGVQRILEQAKMMVILLVGNHDQVSTQSGDHCLGPLLPVARIADKPEWRMIGKVDFFLVPFQPGPAVEWLPKVLEEHLGGTTVKARPGACMLLHLGLSESSTPDYLRGAHDVVPASMVSDLCKQYGFTAAFAGNWHSHKVLRKKPLVCQVGALCPTGWDNEGLDGYGALTLWDGQEMNVEWIPGPRFLKMRADDDLEIPDEHQVFIQILADSKQTSGALATIDEAKDEGMIIGGEVVPDIAEVKAATRKAAMVARSADTLDEALAGYVAEMAIPEEVTREAVLETVKGYLGAG